MKQRIAIFIFMHRLLQFVAHAQAPVSSPFTETFEAGLAGWSNAGSPFWSAFEGSLRVTFSARSYPTMDTAILVANAGASAGGFTGNLSDNASPRELLIFEFVCEQALPSELSVDMTGPGGRYRAYLNAQLTGVGATNRIFLPLHSPGPAPWQLGLPDAFRFQATIGAIESIEIRVVPSGLGAQSYRLDNMMMRSLHASTGLQLEETSGAATMVWTEVMPGSSYEVEISDDLSAPGGGWRSSGRTFKATDELLTFPDPGSTGAVFRAYRLRMK